MEDQYTIFQREEPAGPAFHLARITHPNPALPNLITVKIPYQGSRNGLPTSSQKAKLEQIEDHLTDTLESALTIFVGRILQPNLSTVYLYSSQPNHPEITVRTGLFKKETFRPESRPDPEWHFYQANFVSSPIEEHMNRNMPLHMVFEQDSNDASKPRPVDFACIFPTRSDLESFLAEAQTLGFTPTDPASWNSPEEPEEPSEDYWCELVKTTSIEPSTIAHISVELEQLAEKYNGEFDGWSCPVVT
ncbi:hypothetical protein CCB80_09405 [Armatimonadetes bacterium Uphvl-Ar1]|nr:hypothetical protein CCB80_09405 [Armatimonadetes bacterium Uphvl-Ar1]